MSRTYHKTKPGGYEYWSKRPLSRNFGCPPCKYSKKLTHRLERLEEKEIIKEELELNDVGSGL